MAKWEIVLEILDDKEEVETTEQVILSARANTSLKTMVLKAFENIVEKHYSDTTDVMDFVKSLHRQAYDWEDLAEDMLTELDIRVSEPTIL